MIRAAAGHVEGRAWLCHERSLADFSHAALRRLALEAVNRGSGFPVERFEGDDLVVRSVRPAVARRCSWRSSWRPMRPRPCSGTAWYTQPRTRHRGDDPGSRAGHRPHAAALGRDPRSGMAAWAPPRAPRHRYPCAMCSTSCVSGNRRHRVADAAGHHVVLDLGGGRYAFYEHLCAGGVRVARRPHAPRPGTGPLGFTGGSTGPHLHFHIADGATPQGAKGRLFALEAFSAC